MLLYFLFRHCLIVVVFVNGEKKVTLWANLRVEAYV